MVVTKIMVKNTSTAPIPRLTIDETWYDAGGGARHRRQGRRSTACCSRAKCRRSTIETPFNAKMKANNYNFSHANGTIKPHKVAKLGDEKEPRRSRRPRPSRRPRKSEKLEVKSSSPK